MNGLLIEAHWLEFYLRACWLAGWEARLLDAETIQQRMAEDVRKVAMMAAGFGGVKPE